MNDEDIDKLIFSKEYQDQKKKILARKRIVRQAELFADKVEDLIAGKALPSKLRKRST